MDITDIVQEDYFQVDFDTRVGKVRAIFETENPKAILVAQNGKYEGVITQKRLLESHIEDDTKASALTQPAPRLDWRADVRDASRMLVEGGTKAAPVFDGERLRGIINEDSILEAVLENLGALRVSDVMSEDIVTVTESSDLGKVINRMREHGVSRVPVINENGYLVGIVTTQDIVDFVTRNMKRTTTGDRVGDSDRMLDLPAYDVMSSPVVTTATNASLDDAVATMIENDYAGLVVTPEDDDRLIAGIVTKTDVLRALSIREEHHLDVQITNINLLDTITRQTIRRSIESVADKFSDMQVQHAHVRFHEHKEKLRGVPLVQCQIRLRTNFGQVAGSGEGYGAETAFYMALDKLERNVIELKGLKHDQEYEGQLLRKLGEL